MDRFSDLMRGVVRVKLFGAFPAGVLNEAVQCAIEIWAVESTDENTLYLSLYENRLDELCAICGRAACELDVLSRRGGRTGLGRLGRRPGLLIGALLVVVLLFSSSLFIWDIEVRGTDRLSRGEVLRALEDCGVGVGSFWPGLETERLRSEMMLRLPEIGWMAVNVNGSRAIVVIAERAEKPIMAEEQGAADLVAARDGLVRRVNVLAGQPQITPGQTVTAGTTLVAGTPWAPRARGAIMAETWYELSAVCPQKEDLKKPAVGSHSRLALLFGKRRLNLYFSSGKAIDGCDKIISEYPVGIKGLFSFPIRLVRERIVPYNTAPGSTYSPGESKQRLYALLERKTEGQILSSSFSPGRAKGLFVLTLRAHCTENIAQPPEKPG